MIVQMRGNKIGVQKLGKGSKDKSFIVTPEDSESLGVIKYLGSNVPDDLKVGMKVFYGDKRQRITIGESEIEVMESDNVFAIAGDAPNEVQKES